MTTRRTLGIVAAFALAAIVAGISVVTAGASSERSFTLLVRYDKSSFETDDVAPKGISVGDQFFFTGALTRDGKPAGRLEDMDVVIDPRIEGFARWATGVRSRSLRSSPHCTPWNRWPHRSTGCLMRCW